MKPIKVLELSEVDRLKLEKGYHNGPTHSFRIRCKSILLKSEGKSAPQIAEMLEVTVPTVYAWVKRYEENGIKGLETRPGQGRKPIMDCSDEEAVRMAIEEDRQSVSKAREAWQNATGKETSDITFKRFLETFVQGCRQSCKCIFVVSLWFPIRTSRHDDKSCSNTCNLDSLSCGLSTSQLMLQISHILLTFRTSSLAFTIEMTFFG